MRRTSLHTHRRRHSHATFHTFRSALNPKKTCGSLAATLAVLIVTASCSDKSVTGLQSNGLTSSDIASIQVSPSQIKGWAGDTVRLHAVAVDGSGNSVSGATFSWSTDDKSTATVSSDGLVTFQDLTDSASTTITASIGSDHHGKSHANNRGGKPAKVTVTPTSASMGVGNTVNLKATVIDQKGNQRHMSLNWSSSNNSVASVTGDGMVTGQSTGTATITADAGPAQGQASVTVTSASGSVSDLAAAAEGPDSVTVRWTQVGDGTGNPADYTLRYGSPTISWGSAYSTEVEVSGNRIGSSESYTFHGLSSGTNYQFQLVSYRGTLNSSATFGPLSNTVSATTDAGSSGGGGSGGSGSGTVGPVASVTATPSSYTFTSIGASVQIQASATDSAGRTVTNAAYTYSSTDASVIAVTSAGVMTAKAVGSAMIIVSAVCCGQSNPAADTITGTVTNGSTSGSGSTQAMYADDFESYGTDSGPSGGANGFSWGQSNHGSGDALAVSTDVAHSGSKSLKFTFAAGGSGDDAWSEQRFNVGENANELWMEWWMHYPSNYAHRNDSPSNNKFFRLWGNDYNSSNKVGASTWASGGGDRLEFDRNVSGGIGPVGQSFSGFPPALNQWFRVRVHVRYPSGGGGQNAALQMWIGDNLVIDNGPSQLSDMVYNSSAPYWNAGYLLGWSNSGFDQTTNIYIDDFKIWDSNPGW